MNIALVTQLFPPESAAGARRVGAMADALSRVSRLTVVTPHPSYPHPSLYGPVANISAFPVVRVGTFAPHHPRLLTRALGECSLAIRLGLRVLSARPDVVVASSPSMFLGPTCLIVARMRRSAFVWDLRDLTWEYAEDQASGHIARGLARKTSALMWSTARRASLVIAATDGIRTALVEHGVSSERIHLALNRPQRGDVSEAAGDAGVHEHARVLYAGVIGRNQALDVLLAVAQLLPDIEFVLAGDGPERAMLESSARGTGLGNLRFLGHVTHADLRRLYESATILFAQTRDTPSLRRDSVPSKLFEYMCFGRPIIYAGRGAAAELLESAGVAVVVPPGDVSAIGSAIRSLVSDRGAAESLAVRARAFVDQGPFRDEIMAAAAAAIAQVAS